MPSSRRMGALAAALVGFFGWSLQVTSPPPVAAAQTAATAPALGPISHAGRWLTDAQGRVVMLHGINISAKFPGDLKGFKQADAEYLAGLGVTVARVAFTLADLMPHPGTIDKSFSETLSRVVALLSAQHIYVLLDFHQDLFGPLTHGDGIPTWATFTDGKPNPTLSFPLGYFHSPAVQAAFANFWADEKGPGNIGIQERFIEGLVDMASKFKHDPFVLGYDLFNEPWEGSGANETACSGTTGCPQLERSLLDPFYSKASKAVRSADPNHLVFAEPFLTFDYTGKSSLPAFGQPMNGLSFHPYVMGQLPNALALSAANGDALLVTEFGAVTNVNTIQGDLGTLDGDRLPWIFWDYQGHATSAQSQATMALAEPYPLAVAGSPSSFGYDPSNGTFHLAYAVAAVPGAHLDHHAATVVVVPTITYPHGYTVSVHGATVTSKPCSPELSLRAQSSSVTVTVTQGGSC